MPQDPTPARLQSPASAERGVTPEDRRRQVTRAQNQVNTDRMRAGAFAAPRTPAPTAPPAKKGVLATLKDRWAPVTKHAPSPSKR